MTPWRVIKIYKRVKKLLDLFEQATLSYESNNHIMSKSLFASRTFWFNALTIALEVAQVLPLPPGAVIIGSSLINIALRYVTSKPVHVAPAAFDDTL